MCPANVVTWSFKPALPDEKPHEFVDGALDYDDNHLLSSFNVPEDTGHVATGGEDLIVVQEPDNIK